MIPLLVIAITLLLDILVTSKPELRDSRWFLAFHAVLARLFGKWPGVQLFVALAVVLVPLAFLQRWSQSNVVLELFLGGAVLWYAYGPSNFYQEAKAFVTAWRNEDTGARAAALMRLSGKRRDKEAAQLATAMKAIFARASDNLFGFLLWFLLIGPVGALLVQLLVALRRDADGECARVSGDVLGYLLWLPARLTAFSFCVMGSFDDGLKGWQHYHPTTKFDRNVDNVGLLRAVGLGALREDLAEEGLEDIGRVEAAQSLVLRSLFLWLGVIAIFSLGGILG